VHGTSPLRTWPGVWPEDLGRSRPRWVPRAQKKCLCVCVSLCVCVCLCVCVFVCVRVCLTIFHSSDIVSMSVCASLDAVIDTYDVSICRYNLYARMHVWIYACCAVSARCVCPAYGLTQQQFALPYISQTQIPWYFTQGRHQTKLAQKLDIIVGYEWGDSLASV
jgi:hypothetical protein